MAACISFASLTDRFYKATFYMAGLKPKTANLSDDTVIHSWVPKNPKPHKPNVVLVHGFGANAMWQWAGIIAKFTASFNVYVPDLLFFGDSYTACADRTVEFQAKCVMGALRSWGVSRMSVVGTSYGGFVVYSMAAQFQEEVERVVLVCADVCWTEKDMEDGTFIVKDLDELASFVMPQTADKLRDMMRVMFHRPPRNVPSFCLNDFINVMCTDNFQQKKELIETLFKGRKLSDLLHPIHQPTQLIWGESERVFPLEAAYRIVRYLDEKPQLVIIKKAGHAVIVEKPKLMYKHIKAFLVDQVSQPKQSNQGYNKQMMHNKSE